MSLGWRVIVYGPDGDWASKDPGDHDIRFDRTFGSLDELREAGLPAIADHEEPFDVSCEDVCLDECQGACGV